MNLIRIPTGGAVHFAEPVARSLPSYRPGVVADFAQTVSIDSSSAAVPIEYRNKCARDQP